MLADVKSLIREGAERLAPYVGKVVEVHYLSGTKPRISRNTLMPLFSAEFLNLGAPEYELHLIHWDWTDPASQKRYAIKRILDEYGNRLFERPDLDFVEADAKTAYWRPRGGQEELRG